MLNDFETFYMERGSPSLAKYHRRKRKRFSFVLRGLLVGGWSKAKPSHLASRGCLSPHYDELIFLESTEGRPLGLLAPESFIFLS